jgi:hypothetical protein
VNLEPGATVFRDWFFHAKGLIFGPSAGRWDPRTRTLTLTNLPENGVVVVTTWRVLDADTVTSESIIRDKEGKTLFEMGLHLKRTTESVRIDETTAAEPLPPQMAVLDRLVGDCQITGVLKDAENPDGLKAAWQSRAHRLLGGRLIATQSIGHPRYKDTFALSTFDVHANAYRRWMFQPDGNVLEYGGGWDEKTQTMKWHWAGKDGSQSTNTWRFSDANRLDWQVVTKDAVGKTTLDFQATSIHQSQPGWVSLFNGKDLNGWVGNSGTWKVGKNGMIGTGVEKKNPPQHLSTARSDRENFHLRLQAHLNPGGSGAIAFRVGKGADASKGIAIQLRHSKPGELEIHPFTMPNPYYVFGSVTKPLKADHWFELEIKADGPRIEILLDGQPASVHTYLPIGAALLDARGAIQLRLDNAKTTLSVRKIEIMELPRKEPDGVSLLNGVDLTGWKMLGHPGWTFKDGVLRGVGQSGKPGILMTEREFADYELELEYKLTKQTDSGIFLRAWPEGNLYGDDFIEVQLIDNASFPKLAADRMHGGLARRAAPKSEAAVALDAWRQAKVRHEGSRVKVWMDASLTVDADIADFPAKGRIGLQLFPQPIEFRNIRIRELKPAAAP